MAVGLFELLGKIAHIHNAHRMGNFLNGLAGGYKHPLGGSHPLVSHELHGGHPHFLFELMQNQYMDNSLVFAELVQNQFVGTLQRANRGVRQAAFWVLLQSACPSVLVEMGFLSNAEEEKWLASAEGKTGIVNGIFDAFEKYYKK